MEISYIYIWNVVGVVLVFFIYLNTHKYLPLEGPSLQSVIFLMHFILFLQTHVTILNLLQNFVLYCNLQWVLCIPKLFDQCRLVLISYQSPSLVSMIYLFCLLWSCSSFIPCGYMNQENSYCFTLFVFLVTCFTQKLHSFIRCFSPFDPLNLYISFQKRYQNGLCM